MTSLDKKPGRVHKVLFAYESVRTETNARILVRCSIATQIKQIQCESASPRARPKNSDRDP